MGKLQPLTQPAAKSDLVLYEGVTTSDGTTLTIEDSALISSNDFLTNATLYIDSGAADKEVRDISTFNDTTGTITVSTAFSTAILSGISYKVLAIIPADIEVTDIKGVGFDTTTDSLVKLHDDHLTYLNATAITGEAAYSLSDVVKISATEKLKDFIAKTGGTVLPAASSLYSELGGALFATATDSLHATATELDEILNLTRVYAAIACSAVETNLFIDDAPTRGTMGRSVKIDLSALAAGDTYVLREYYRLTNAGAYFKISNDAANTFVGVQDPVLKSIELEPYLYGCKITTQKTAGTDRTINYESFVEA